MTDPPIVCQASILWPDVELAASCLLLSSVLKPLETLCLQHSAPCQEGRFNVAEVTGEAPAVPGTTQSRPVLSTGAHV